MLKRSLCCAIFAALLAPTAATAAQDLDEPYLAVGLMLGLGGEVEIDTASVSGAGGQIMIDPQNNPEADAEVGIGGGARYIYPLHRYFALGGKFALLTWRSDANTDGGRNLAFDLALVPQARVPLSAAVELYLSVPVGITLDVLNEIDSSVRIAGPLASGSLEADTGFGFNLAALVGARFALTRDLGLFGELGYSLHSVSHDIEGRVTVAGVSAAATFELDVSFWQIALNAGLYF